MNDNLLIVPFTILIDNREGKPYQFNNIPSTHAQAGKQILVKTKTLYLPTGDYSIEGLTEKIAVERKSLVDLYQSLGKHRSRLKNEMDRLAEMDFAAFVIEADWRMICKPASYQSDWQSKVPPRAIFESILSWMQRWSGVHWVTAGSARMGELVTFSILQRYWNRNLKARS